MFMINFQILYIQISKSRAGGLGLQVHVSFVCKGCIRGSGCGGGGGGWVGESTDLMYY